jgi:hypothetical protein
MKFFLILGLSVLFMKPASPMVTDSVETKISKRGITIGAIVNPAYCFRYLHVTNGGDIEKMIVDSRNEIEKYRIGFSAGANVTFEISKHLSFESGIIYSSKGYQMNLSALNFGDQLDPRYGFTYQTSNTSGLNWKYFYNYLVIPIRLDYFSNGRKIQLATSAGFNVNVFLNSYEKIGSEKINYNYSYARLGISAFLAAGALYHINNRFHFTLMPNFDYSLTALFNAPIREHHWSAGVLAGFGYRLGK